MAPGEIEGRRFEARQQRLVCILKRVDGRVEVEIEVEVTADQVVRRESVESLDADALRVEVLSPKDQHPGGGGGGGGTGTRSTG